MIASKNSCQNLINYQKVKHPCFLILIATSQNVSEPLHTKGNQISFYVNELQESKGKSDKTYILLDFPPAVYRVSQTGTWDCRRAKNFSFISSILNTITYQELTIN